MICARCGDFTSEERLIHTREGMCCMQCVSENPDELGEDLQDAYYGITED